MNIFSAEYITNLIFIVIKPFLYVALFLIVLQIPGMIFRIVSSAVVNFFSTGLPERQIKNRRKNLELLVDTVDLFTNLKDINQK